MRIKNINDIVKSKIHQTSKSLGFVENKNESNLTKKTEILGSDILYLDDGDDGADYFLGWDDASDFYWNNDFTVSGFSYSLMT